MKALLFLSKGLFFLSVFLLLGITESAIAQNAIESKSIFKVDDFSKIDLSKVKTPAKAKKDSTSKIDSTSIKIVAHILDSLKNSTKKPIHFDCNNAEASKPVILGDLNRIDTRVFDVTKSTNIDIGLFGGSATLAKNEVLIQANFIVYKDFICGDATTTRILVGMTLYLRVSDIKASVGYKSLPNISAEVQLKQGNASYQLQFYGLTKSINFGDLPDFGDLNVDNYSKIMTAWDKIKNSLDKNSEVDPIVIPNYKEAAITTAN